ncbi:predicted protein [Pyrenophora tritici-repentis Pt-1C-BFP]|uniref:Uncharacterized protein n=1 Tax=Pyrenophora tritici-repentis (strain Pt-1C-BFP) TaxID=426418 RepID=B2WHB1_PYRTR|nr:uncharacterized protein PTRG_09370 [Pyrenophora tritici-repentis Pt-1C-BFP]EDU42421.1 predicted protein [Pyrenophora tritici-repentis Pt-1C-BFP]
MPVYIKVYCGQSEGHGEKVSRYTLFLKLKGVIRVSVHNSVFQCGTCTGTGQRRLLL